MSGNSAEKDVLDPIIVTLRAERERLGLTQTDVAQLVGRKTYQTVHQWERGLNTPTLANLRTWANSLGFDLALTRVTASRGDHQRAGRGRPVA
jgi:transcriptional regulator with XRE-family HTH domain